MSVWWSDRRRIEGFGYPVDGKTTDSVVRGESPSDQNLRSMDVVGVRYLNLAHASGAAQQCLRCGSAADPQFDGWMDGISAYHGFDGNTSQSRLVLWRLLALVSKPCPSAEIMGELDWLVVLERHERRSSDWAGDTHHKLAVAPEALQLGLRQVCGLDQRWKGVCWLPNAQADRKNSPKQPMKPAASDS